ncbi:MAG: dephospho-CoA kinase [Phycisphaerae bacterium]|nr:dephospho-CoA kinase [Phycisphaerae bacterium]
MTHHKPVIGLVGGIGAGKSTVAAEFSRLGCFAIDADAVGHAVLREPAVRDAVAAAFGADVLDAAGEVDRKALAGVVFGDEAALATLNALTHPRIAERISRLVEQARRDEAVAAVVLDAAVLLEAGWDPVCTDCVFVSAPNPVRLARVRSNRGWDEASWARREKTQISLDKKASRCEYTVDNSSDIPHVRQQVQQVFHRILAKSRA